MISIIVAATRNHMIGKDNDLPWHLSNDLKRFRTLTTGHAVIMGRKTYDHLIQRIGRLLPERTNIIVTRQQSLAVPGAIVAHSLTEAFDKADVDRAEVFVIGGAALYASALPYADRIYLTEIDTELDGDAYFPALNIHEWREVSRTAHTKDAKNDYNYSFVTYDRSI